MIQKPFARGARISDTSKYMIVPVTFDNFPKVIVPCSVDYSPSGMHTPVVGNVLIYRPANILSRGMGTKWPVGSKLLYSHRTGLSTYWEEEQREVRLLILGDSSLFAKLGMLNHTHT